MSERWLKVLLVDPSWDERAGEPKRAPLQSSVAAALSDKSLNTRSHLLDLHHHRRKMFDNHSLLLDAIRDCHYRCYFYRLKAYSTSYRKMSFYGDAVDIRLSETRLSIRWKDV